MLDELELPPLQVVVEQPPQPRAMALAVRVPCVLRFKPFRMGIFAAKGWGTEARIFVATIMTHF